MCLICRQKYKQECLLRISFSGGALCIGDSGEDIGRGCYVCFEEKCVKGLKKQIVENSLRTGLADDEWMELVLLLNNLVSQKI